MRTLKLVKAACAAALFLAAPNVSMADDDSSSDVEGGFVKAIEQSDAVIIRVPIRENGDENTNAAEIRVYQGDRVTNAQEAAAAFGASVDGTDMPTVSEDSSTSDSSTYWGWRYGWRGYGWRSNYYYNSYYPSYYNYGYRYNYGYPSYYNYYGSYYPNYGYRYYYYNRYW